MRNSCSVVGVSLTTEPVSTFSPKLLRRATYHDLHVRLISAIELISRTIFIDQSIRAATLLGAIRSPSLSLLIIDEAVSRARVPILRLSVAMADPGRTVRFYNHRDFFTDIAFVRARADAPVFGDGVEAERAGTYARIYSAPVTPIDADVGIDVSVGGVVALAVGLVGVVVDVDGPCGGGEGSEGKNDDEEVHVEEARETVCEAGVYGGKYEEVRYVELCRGKVCRAEVYGGEVRGDDGCEGNVCEGNACEGTCVWR